MTLDTAKKSQTETPFLMTTSKAKPGTPLADRVRDQTKELPVAPSAFSAASLSLSTSVPRERLVSGPENSFPTVAKNLTGETFALPSNIDSSSYSMTQVPRLCMRCARVCVLLLCCWVLGVWVRVQLTPWRREEFTVYRHLLPVLALPLTHTSSISLTRSVCVPVYWYLFWPIRLIKQ